MLNKFEEYLKLNVNKKSSRDSYLYHVQAFFKTYKEFNQDTINSYLANIVDKDLSNNYFNKIIFSLSHYAKFQKLKIEFPTSKKPAEKDIPYIKYEELEFITKYITQLFSDYKKRELVLKFLFYTGLRPSEILNLRREDIDSKTRIVTINESKSNKYRKVKYSSAIQNEIETFFNSETQITNAFNITKTYLTYMIKKIKTELNMNKKLNVYSLRHSFAKYCLKQGMSIDRLQKLMGHSDIKITQRYAKTTEEEALFDYDKYIN